ncbi:MAG: DUF2791 family P-loop domain-containing protein [Armatimonadetes bacterium]|nr:DUF2791 family P-loop domain-containing protein [Armatimonadota bacterium]
MQSQATFESLSIIEALRSGIPSRSVSRTFSQGRKEILGDLEGLLTRVKEREQGEGFVFQAEFGNGKTHLLNQIFDLALARNFVVSKVVLNKETPLNQLHPLFQKVARNCFLPGQSLPGFDQPLSRMTLNDPAVENLLIYADSHLHPRLKIVLETLLRADEQYFHILYGDLQGDFMGSQILKSIYRLTFRKAIRTPGLRKADSQEIMDCFRFLTLLFKAMGYSGWVILFDEAELVQRHGPKARIKAYLNLSHLMNLNDTLQVPLLGIFAVASTYTLFVNAKNELENLPQRAAEEMDQEVSETVRKVILRFLEARSLPDLSPGDYEEIAGQVENLHGLAFGWKPQLDLSELLQIGTVERRVRTMVRGMVQRLDLTSLERPSEIEIQPIEDQFLEEEEGFFRAAHDDLDEDDS